MTQQLVWLIPGLPLAAFVLLILTGDRLPRAAVAVTAVTAAAGSALVAAIVIGVYLALPPAGGTVLQTLGQWVDAGGLSARIALRLDPLSLVMTAVVTGLALLIQLGSVTLPAAAADYRHHCAWLSLAAFGLLVLVQAENLLLVYLGWELAALAGYVLIGLGPERAAAARAARMVFLVTRLGGAAVLVALLLLFTELGTLHLPTLLARAGSSWGVGDPRAVAVAALLAGGLAVRAAQVPLQAWLPRATAAAAPVSAFVHGATLGAAAVYLIARTHTLFTLAPVVQAALALVGVVTLLVAAVRALAERDLLRLVGHAAISQTGVMMLALGLGAPVAAVFHFVTHASASALLFLATGILVTAGGGERDLFRLGGLGRRLPGVALAFGIGAASLAALPLVTAGFYSQTAMLHAAFAAPLGGPLASALMLLGTFLTALYIFRALFALLRGEQASMPIERGPNRLEGIVLALLAVLALTGGVVGMPPALGGFQPLPELLNHVLPASDPPAAPLSLRGAGLMLAQAAVALAGFVLAWWLYREGAPWVQETGTVARMARRGHGLSARGGRLVRRCTAMVRAGGRDVAHGLHRRLAALAVWGHHHLRDSQSGRLRAYAVGMVGGVVVLISIVVLP